MSIAQSLMGRLRPLVGLKAWDYCVLWKLSDDHRFIKLMDCCCAGAEQGIENVAEELYIPAVSCRDATTQHPRSSYCELLSQLPFSIPLDSGVHAETLISNQPSWLHLSSSSTSSGLDVTQEAVGTRVWIPILGGLIELFVSKQVSEDQNVIDFVTAQCSIAMEQEVMVSPDNIDPGFSSINDLETKPYSLSGEIDQNGISGVSLPPYDMPAEPIQRCGPSMNFFPQFSIYQAENDTRNDQTILEGEHESFFGDRQIGMNPICSSVDSEFQQDIGSNGLRCMNPNLGNTEEHPNNDNESFKQENGQSGSISDCSDQIDDEEAPKYRRKSGKGTQAKNLMAERKRRKKLNDRLYELRSLVPNISKLDRASILGDAIEYVMTLQKQAKELQDELEGNSDVDDGLNKQNNNGDSAHNRAFNSGFYAGPSCKDSGNSSKQKHHSENASEKGQEMEPQVDVTQIDGKFHVRVVCEHKTGGFTRLMDALECLGLEVSNATMTSFRSLVSNVLIVERKDTEMVQADHLRDSLLEITKNTSRELSDHDLIGSSAAESNKQQFDHHGDDYHHQYHGHQQLDNHCHHTISHQNENHHHHHPLPYHHHHNQNQV